MWTLAHLLLQLNFLPLNSIRKFKYSCWSVRPQFSVAWKKMNYTVQPRTHIYILKVHVVRMQISVQLNENSVEISIIHLLCCVRRASSYPVRHPHFQPSYSFMALAQASMVLKRKVCAHERRVICTAIYTSMYIYIIHTRKHNTTVALLKLIVHPPACLAMLWVSICLLAYRWSSSYMQCNVLYSLNKKTEWVGIEHILVGNLVEEVSQSWKFKSSLIISHFTLNTHLS